MTYTKTWRQKLGNRTDGQYNRLLVQLSSHFEKTAKHQTWDGAHNGDIQSIKDSEEQRSNP